jgi:hypothetical protein
VIGMVAACAWPTSAIPTSAATPAQTVFFIRSLPFRRTIEAAPEENPSSVLPHCLLGASIPERPEARGGPWSKVFPLST